MDEKLTRCRVTAAMQGAPLGAVVLVNLDDPDMKVLLEKKFVVPLEDAAPSPSEAAGDVAAASAGDSFGEAPAGAVGAPEGQQPLG